mgnify:CR=1 FL=1
MIKNKTVFEVEVSGRPFRFECYPDSSLVDVANALDQMKNYISERLKAAQEASQEQCKECKEEV